MSRPIKFRAWDKNEKRMISAEEVEKSKGNLLAIGFHGLPIAIDKDSFKDDEIVGWNVDHYLVLMQFTGLLDKNGKEVYEGDIVHSDYWKNTWEVQWCDGKRELLGGQVGWMLNDERWSPVGHVQELTAHCEVSEPDGRRDYFNGHVLGNIYENPELARQ